MGRSKVNSKIEKRLHALKRKTLEPLVREQIQNVHNNVLAEVSGQQYRKPVPKNAFLHPDDPDAEFPQYTPAPIIDLRGYKSEHSGHEFRGASKKKTLGHI